MQVSVESPSNIERRVTVVVPVEKFDEAYGNRLKKLSKTAKVKGFRQGKVPADIIKQRFGDSARQEALSEVIQSSLYAAINQEKLNPVDVPMVEPKTILPGQPLEFVATFEVLPPIPAVKFEVSEIEKINSKLENQDVQKVIKHLQEQHVVWKKADRSAAEKDQVVIDFVGSMDGKPFDGGQAHDYPIVLGSKMMIPGFEEGLIGMSAGESKVLALTFPDNYFAKEFSAKTAEFQTKVIKVSEPVYPEIDSAFAKKLGVKSGEVADLELEIKKNLERELVRVVQGKLKLQVFSKLLEQNPVEVPKSLIEKEANRLHNEVHPHHGQKPHQHSEAEMQQFKEAAKQNIVLGLLVGELVKIHQIIPDKQRIINYITNLSSSYENPEEVQKWYASNKRQMAEVEMRVIEEQVLEKLLESVKITEKMLSYDEFVKTVK